MDNKGTAKDRVEKAVLEILSENGKLTVTNIIGKASIGRSTYYYHYYDPRDIIRDIIKKVTEDIAEALLGQLKLSASSTPHREIREPESTSPTATLPMCNCVYAHRHTLSVLFASEYRNELIAALMTSIHDFLNRTVITVSSSRSGQTLRYSQGLVFDYLINRITMQTIGIILLWNQKHFELSAQQMVELISELTDLHILYIEAL